MKSISISAYVNTMLERKVRQSHYVRCYQDTQDIPRRKNMEVHYIVRPRNVDDLHSKNTYLAVSPYDTSDSEGTCSERDSRVCLPSPRPLSSAQALAARASPSPSGAALRRSPLPPPLPLPRTSLCGHQETWEREMLRLPARLFLFEATALKQSLTALTSSSGIWRSTPAAKTKSNSKVVLNNSGAGGEWKEHCAGDVRLLRAEREPRVRVLMRRDKTRAPCANHLVTIDMELHPAVGAGLASGQADRIWAYHVLADYAEGCPQSRVIALQFQSGRAARRWRAKFDEARHLLETESDA